MAGKPRCILVAEDDAGVRDLIRTHLELAGYDAYTAHNGVEALRRVRELKPDGLVLDINMPEMDGLAVLTALRNEEASRRPPVLVLTARNAPEDVRTAIRLGAKDYLTKPFNELQLLSRVARLLHRREPPPPGAKPPVYI